jgi:hypothetical protein
MTTTRRTRVCAATAAILVLSSPPASPQLLQKLTTQVRSTVGAITCPQLQTSPKLDDGNGQHVVWGTTGGPDDTVWGNIAPVADDRGSPPDGC